MSGQIVHTGDHVCGLMPTAVAAGAVWECNCGQQWVRVPSREGYPSCRGATEHTPEEITDAFAQVVAELTDLGLRKRATVMLAEVSRALGAA